MPILDGHEVFLLKGASEFRLARTPAEVERELARGFRPSVVLLYVGANAARGWVLAQRLASHPACSEVPILKLSGDEERLRLTLMNEDASDLLSDPSQLEEVLGILEELCFDLQGAGFPWAGQVDEAEVASWIDGPLAEAEPAF